MENENYLTEEKLGIILQKLFPDLKIIKQYKIYNRKFDFMFEVSEDHPYFDFFDNDGRFDLDIKRIKILIEYDGSYHYEKNSQARKDENLSGNMFGYQQIDEDVILIRIPYWLQLTPEIVKYLFGSELDFSQDFPHGFISKNCRTPDNFCLLGEQRFINELSDLYFQFKHIYNDVISSLRKKDVKGLCYSDKLREIIYTENYFG